MRVVDGGASSSVVTLWERVRAFVAGVRAAAARGASVGGGVSSFGRGASSRGVSPGLLWMFLASSQDLHRDMGCGSSDARDAPGDAPGDAPSGEVDEEILARKRRRFIKGVNEEVAASLHAAVSSALKKYVAAERASGNVVVRTYEHQALGLIVSVQAATDDARKASSSARRKDWTSVYVEEVADDEPRIRPTDELVIVNGELVAIRDDDRMTERERAAEFEKLKRGVARAPRPLVLKFIKGDRVRRELAFARLKERRALGAWDRAVPPRTPAVAAARATLGRVEAYKAAALAAAASGDVARARDDAAAARAGCAALEKSVDAQARTAAAAGAKVLLLGDGPRLVEVCVGIESSTRLQCARN